MSNSKLIDNYLKKHFRSENRNYQKEKKRCKKEYSDWVDDEYNLLDNQFMWGINSRENSSLPPSFLTWNDAYIYYNRINRKYYMEVDTSCYTLGKYVGEEPDPWAELDRLDQINKAFRDYMIKNNLRIDYFGLPFFHGELEADSLTQLYTRWRTYLEGYRWYVNSYKKTKEIKNDEEKND